MMHSCCSEATSIECVTEVQGVRHRRRRLKLAVLMHALCLQVCGQYAN